ncbi:hypothetical protein ABIE69_000706 [Rhodobacteraceae bacterium MBR-64]|jgi:hypothetical protein
MADPANTDPTKAPLGVMTMAYGDHLLLARWVEYHARQVDRRHIYVLSHGNDPEHRRIAKGCNVIALPRDPSGYRFDRRRWNMINGFASGLLRYYDWMIVNDVDEFVIVDPDVAPDLITYLARYEGQKQPLSICPFGIELIHNPAAEPDPIEDGVPILSRRRVFRANANYAKPCITRGREVAFTPGGHANNHKPRFLDPHLYLVHLRFFDFDHAVARLEERRSIADDRVADGTLDDQTRNVWAKGLESFRKMATGVAEGEDATLSDFRQKMVDGAQDLHNGAVTFWGGGRSRDLYRLPARFAHIF